MAVQRNRQDVPDEKSALSALFPQGKSITDKIARFGFQHNIVPDYLVSQITGNAQIRDIKHVAPLDRVLQIAENMARGEPTDPIVVSFDNIMIDGHTRRAAALRVKRMTLPAFVLTSPYKDDGTPHQRGIQNSMHMLGTVLNQHGLPMTKQELRLQIERIGPNAGYEAARLAQLLGVQESFVQNIFAEMRAKERFAVVKYEPERDLTASQLRSLGRAQLNNEPFKTLAKLAVDANLTPVEIDHLRKEAKAKLGDSAAMTYLEQERIARANQIQQYTQDGKTDTANALLLRQRLGFILKFKENPEALCEHNPLSVAKHISDIKGSIAVLDHVLIEQGVEGD